MNLDDLDKHVSRSKRLIVFALFLLPLAYVLWFGVAQEKPLSVKTEDWGAFGDFIGGILNPLVALSAFYWLVHSVVIQKTELQATTAALQASQQAQQDQALTLADQRYDATFFALLEQHNVVLNALTAKQPRSNASQSLMPVAAVSRVNSIHQAVFYSDTIDEARVLLEQFNKDCGHYFRCLYQILKFVAIKCPGTSIGPAFENAALLNDPVTIEEKFYTNIVRSFLNYEMTQLLAVNCCVQDHDDSYYKYKLLIERYSFLEHMPFETSMDSAHPNSLLSQARKIYRPVAFGKSNFLPD